MKQKLQQLIDQHLERTSPLQNLTKLHGDASARIYYRATLQDKKTLIVMEMPVGPASASEEITNFRGEVQGLPFLNVARFLASCHLPVPKIYGYSSSDRLMILEDLGNATMASCIDNGGDAEIQRWYERAVDLLVELQARTANRSQRDCIALQRSFDEVLLNWEFDHFLEYGLNARGIIVTPTDLDIFIKQTRAISEEIGALSFCFTHRDYQSRNLMVKDDQLWIIDFQDALLGPQVYDLVALTRDSYVKLPKSLLQSLIERYATAMNRNVAEVEREHRLVTVQRKLKDAGRFVYIDREKNNPNFLQYIPTSLRYVRDALEKLSEYHQFFSMLKKYIPEWRS